jgi:hypothetical protein
MSNISRQESVQEWVSFLNNSYMEFNGIDVYVFKLDKEKTDIDDLYGAENFGGARIYLSPFKIKSIYLEKEWTQNLGTDTFPYLEVQEDAVFSVNFDNMVRIIRDLKHKFLSEIQIKYSGSSAAYAQKDENKFEIHLKNDIYSFDLNDSRYRTTEKLKKEINNISPEIQAVLIGENDLSSNLVNFRKTSFMRKTLSIFSEDETYKNCTDIIEKGDLILTDKFFLYEVHSNIPSGNFGWSYSTLTLTGNVRSLDKVELPNNWNDLIARREYGLRDKINLE